MAQTVKRLPTVWETWVRSLGQEDPLEKEMATHSSTFTWKIPWMEKHGSLWGRWIKCSKQTYRLAEWIQKQDPHILCIQETHFRPQDTHRLKVRGWKKYIPCKWEAKESWSSNPHIRQNRTQNKEDYKR